MGKEKKKSTSKAKEGEVVTSAQKVETQKSNPTMIILVLVLVIVGLCGLCAFCGSLPFLFA